MKRSTSLPGTSAVTSMAKRTTKGIAVGGPSAKQLADLDRRSTQKGIIVGAQPDELARRK
jgi:hypothetical protein